MKRKHSDSEEKVQKPNDEGKKLKLNPKKNSKTLAGQKQTEKLSAEPSEKKGRRPTKKTRAKIRNHEDHEDQEAPAGTAGTAGTAAGKPAKPKATEDVEAEQQRRALQREIQQLVMRHNSAARHGQIVSKIDALFLTIVHMCSQSGLQHEPGFLLVCVSMLVGDWVQGSDPFAFPPFGRLNPRRTLANRRDYLGSFEA